MALLTRSIVTAASWKARISDGSPSEVGEGGAVDSLSADEDVDGWWTGVGGAMAASWAEAG